MSDVKRLLSEATPLPWHVRDRGIGFEVHVGDPMQGCEGPEPRWCQSINEGHRDTMEEADAALIVYAVNRLPDYEAAVEALDALWEAGDVVNYDDTEPDPGYGDWRRFTAALDDASAALSPPTR